MRRVRPPLSLMIFDFNYAIPSIIHMGMRAPKIWEIQVFLSLYYKRSIE